MTDIDWHKVYPNGLDAEFVSGYRDANDPDIATAGDNRSPAYRHSFEVRRAEIAGKPIPAAISRQRVAEIEAEAAKWQI